jgi:hypothetical protein
VAECRNYGTRDRKRCVWEVRRKYWPEMAVEAGKMQDNRRARKVWGKAFADLEKLV